MTKQLNNRQGFTLIEVMIVVMIMALLTAIALPNWFTARSSSNTRVCQDNLRILSEAKQRWGMEHNKHGSTIPVWDDLVPVYLKGQRPSCPGGGIYTLDNLNQEPTCSLGGEHVAP